METSIFHSDRALRVEGPALASAGAEGLVPLRLAGTESINELYEYRLTLQTPDRPLLSNIDGDYDLSSFISREITCKIELDGSGTLIPGSPGLTGKPNKGAGIREISGIVSEASFIGVENRHSLYELVIKPWLHIATKNEDSRAFLNLTPIQMVDQILAKYPFSVIKRLSEKYPERDLAWQFNESDYEFVTRILQEYGINFHFEHSGGVHHLVLSDSNAGFGPTQAAAYREISWFPKGQRVDEEFIHTFTPVERLVSGAYASRDYDYTRSKATMEARYEDPRQTGFNRQEVYRWRTSSHGSDYSQPLAGSATTTTTNAAGQTVPANRTEAQGMFLARIRHQAMRQHGNRAKGAGHIRGIVSGTTFNLKNNPKKSANTEYIVISSQLEIENVSQDTARALAAGLPNNGVNLGKMLTAILPTAQRQLGLWQVNAAFEVQTAKEIVRPEQTRPKPRIYGTEVGRVTGPDDATAQSNIFTDWLGRIRVKLPFDRHGPGNENSSCWVRVMSPWAGNQLGQIQIPRIGQEVVISFVGGDIDQPICIGLVHNELNLPPWSLPDQQALSGIRTRELNNGGGGNSAAGRSNVLVMDDTKDHIQVQLKSDFKCASLSLGDITRIGGNAGRQDARRAGFELRADAHGAVRAKDGLLISTEARENALAHITDMAETTTRLTQARAQVESHANAAQKFTAQDANDDQAEVAQGLKDQNTEIKGEDKKELTSPHIVIASPAGIASTTNGSTHQHSMQHHAITAAEHLSLSIGKKLLATAASGIRLFALRGGAKIVAAMDKIILQAHADGIDIEAKKDIRIVSAETLHLIGVKKLILQGGSSYAEFSDAGITHGTGGTWSAHATSHIFDGPKALNAPEVKLQQCAAKVAAAANGHHAIVPL